MKKIMLVLSFFLVAASLSACANTFHGAGQDMEKAGKNIQDTF
jgi:predicted small secreted protein